MTTATATRKVTIYSADNIYVCGLTSGAAAGWSFDGSALVHCGGTRINLTTEAANRIADAVATAVPAQSETLTGYQLSQLPEAEQCGYEYSHTSDVHGIYRRSVPAQTVTLPLDRADIVSMGR